MIMLIEIIVTNLEEALQAEEYGASRLELIHAFTDGGLSPQFQLAKVICSHVNIPVNIMVRPHARSFIYSAADMRIMQCEIDALLTHTKVNAIVFGSLTEKLTLNFKQLEAVIRQLEGTGCELTFHRAIDVSINPVAAFEALQTYRDTVTRVLTSGGANTASEGLATLVKMQQFCLKGGAILLPGSGINLDNVLQIIKETKPTELHIGTGVRKDGLLNAELFKQLLVQVN